LVANAGHHSALPAIEIGSFMKTLRGQAGMSAQALEFTILTAARSGEVRGARWAEIDLDAATWSVPGERMKAGKEHRVPLSDAALAILNALPHEDRNALVFASPRGGMLSDMSLTAVLRRMKVDAVPHGFRSSFRDWCAERTNHPREVAEMALAHAIGDKVEAAYRRGDLFEKRRRLMKDWAAFCANPEIRKGSVISMNTSRR
jgi:integrase